MGKTSFKRYLLPDSGDWDHSSQPCVVTIKTDSKSWEDKFRFEIQKNIYTNILLLQYDPDLSYRNDILTGNINSEIKQQKTIYVYYIEDKNKVIQIAETSEKTAADYIKGNLASFYPNR